jgi:receptor protein-tyrosine kinase
MPQSEHVESQETSFDLSELFAFLWLKKFRIIFVAFIIIVLGAYYVTNKTKLYNSRAILLLSDASSSSIALPNLSFGSSDTSQLDTHIEFIRSRQFLKTVVTNLKLHLEPEFLPRVDESVGEPNIDYTVGIVRQNISLGKLSNTDMLRVSYVSESPQISMDVANAVGPAFFDFQAQRRRELADSASQQLDSQVSDLQENLIQSEKRLQGFLESNELVDIRSQIELIQNEISALLREKLMNGQTLSELNASVKQIELYEGNTERLLQIPIILNNRLISDLRRQLLLAEQDLIEISKRYKEKHHRYIAVKSVLDNLKGELTLLLKRLSSSIKQEFQALTQRQKQLQLQIVGARDKHNQFGRLEVELTRLQREVESNQKLYEAFLARLQETEVLRDSGQQSNYAIVDFATLPTSSFKPNVPLFLAMITVLSFILSTGFWLLLHLISDRQAKIKQHLKQLQVPLLAEIPKKAKVSKVSQSKDIGVEYAYSESVRSLRTTISIRTSQKKGSSIVLMSPSDSKSGQNLKASLIQSFGKLEETLLIDADLREEFAKKVLKIPDNHPGITNFLERKAKFTKCLYRRQNSRLTILPGGEVTSDPLVYLSNPTFRALAEKLLSIYPRIFINTPPINSFSDALAISDSADNVVLICDPEKDGCDELVESIQRLKEADIPILGVVMCNVGRPKRAIGFRAKPKVV